MFLDWETVSVFKVPIGLAVAAAAGAETRAAASGKPISCVGAAVQQSDLMVDLQAHFASMVDAGSVEQRIGFSTGKAAEQDGLSVLPCVA